jgi:hypothetical protein
MTKTKLSVNDQNLIDKANTIGYTEWYIVSDLMDLAESEEAKETLKRLSLRLYRTEEGKNGDM